MQLNLCKKDLCFINENTKNYTSLTVYFRIVLFFLKKQMKKSDFLIYFFILILLILISYDASNKNQFFTIIPSTFFSYEDTEKKVIHKIAPFKVSGDSIKYVHFTKYGEEKFTPHIVAHDNCEVIDTDNWECGNSGTYGTITMISGRFSGFVGLKKVKYKKDIIWFGLRIFSYD
jgi:hypothetical protein